MPLINRNIYTSVRSALDGCAYDISEPCCHGIKDIKDPNLSNEFYQLLNTPYKTETTNVVKGDKTEKHIIFQKYQDVRMFQNLMHYWTHDTEAQNLLEMSHGKTDKLSVQICVLQSILDDIAGVESYDPNVEVNSVPDLTGTDRLDVLLDMVCNEQNPLKKQKLQLEIILQQVDLGNIKSAEINAHVTDINHRAQKEVKARREEQARQAQKKQHNVYAKRYEDEKPQRESAARLEAHNNYRFQEFKTIYKDTYKAAFFKNPWSTMKVKLDRGEFTTLAQILDYADKHPKTRSAKILNQLRLNWVQEDQQPDVAPINHNPTATF